MYVAVLFLCADVLSLSTTSFIARMMMMMMMVVLRMCVSHLKRKWQHSSTLAWRHRAIQNVSFRTQPLYPSIPSALTILFSYLRCTSSVYPIGCSCCSWVMSIIVVQITRRNTYTGQRERERMCEKEGRLSLRCCCLFNMPMMRCTHRQ